MAAAGETDIVLASKVSFQISSFSGGGIIIISTISHVMIRHCQPSAAVLILTPTIITIITMTTIIIMITIINQVQELGRRWSQLQNCLMRLQVIISVTIIFFAVINDHHSCHNKLSSVVIIFHFVARIDKRGERI